MQKKVLIMSLLGVSAAALGAVASSVPAKKRDARHAEFAVPVPAGGEAVLTYTVRYRWPQGMRP